MLRWVRCGRLASLWRIAEISGSPIRSSSVCGLSLGELADSSGAKDDGDFSLSLEEAQRQQHLYIAEHVGIGPGTRVLDLGCGWGPLLNFIRDRGGEGGLRSLSPRLSRASATTSMCIDGCPPTVSPRYGTSDVSMSSRLRPRRGLA